MTHLREQLQATLGSAYTLERELGGGGMSRVFLAHDATLRRDVVVKVLPPELVAGVNVERFRREILVAAGLQHPHIVPVHSSGETDGLPWFIMPFIQGESLRQRLARAPLAIAECVSILREVAKALAYAHEHGVVHRDIKPDNVLLTGGTAVVTDFGIAKALSAARTADDASATRGSLTQVGTSIGTPMYMAPEQAAADPDTDARADIYSFGCMAYELLAGRPPFVGMSPHKLLAAHMAERPQNVGDLRPDTPPPLADLVMRCLEKEPNHRPSSAADVVRLLDSVTSTSGSGEATSAALLGRNVRLRVALGVWIAVFFGAWVVAKAAIIAIGLPTWVVPGALIVAGLGLPAILFTAFVQRTARRALTRTPTLTPGGTVAPQSTMATIAIKAVPHVSWSRTVRGGMMAFGVLVVIIMTFMILRALGIGPAGSLLAAGRMTAREPLLIADFRVTKGDSTLAGVVAEALRASLAQSSAITLVPASAVAAELQRMQRPSGTRLDLALARDVAQRQGIKAIVDGDLGAIGAGYVVTVRLVTADSGVILTTVQRVVDGPKELIAGMDAIGRELRGKIGESLRAVQNAPPLDQVTTPSLEALRLYTEGARAYDAGGDLVTAVARLRQAVAIDTGFAMAWRKLGAVYGAGNYPASTRDSVLENAYRFRDRLTPNERLVTTAAYFMRGPGRSRARAAAANEQLLAQGDSGFSVMNEALILMYRRRYAAAESLFIASKRIMKGSQLPYINLVSAQSDAKEFDKAQQTVAEGLKLFPSPTARAFMLFASSISREAAGDIAGGERIADSLAASAPPNVRSRTLRLQVGFAMMHGRAAEAASRLAARRTLDASNGVRSIPLDDSLTLSAYDVSVDRRDHAIQRLDDALAATPLQSLAPADRNYLAVAATYAQAGRPDKAKLILAQRAREVRDTALLRDQTPELHSVLASIAIAEKHPVDAIREIWKSDSLPDGPFSDCDLCTYATLARAYDKASMPDSSIVYFEKFFASGFISRLSVDAITRAPAARRLGELYEGKGDRAKAYHYYQMFVDLWKSADPELQPQVADVRKRMVRLGDAERR